MIRRLAAFSPILREITETTYQFAQPFGVSGDKFARALGKFATPHREAIRETVARYQQHKS